MSNQSVSERLHDSLGKIIATTQPGERLPSEPKLAKQLGVSRATLREAMRTFETQGRIHRRQGAGTFITQPSGVIESGLEVLESIEKLARRIDLPVELGDRQIEQRAASETEAQALNLTQGANVICVSRIVIAEERPVAYLVDVLPEDLLNEEELKKSQSSSVLDLLLQRGEPKLMTSRTEITAVTASSKLARSFGIQRGDVLLRFVASLYAADGRIVDFSHSYFLPGYFRFHVIRRVG